MEDGEIEQSVKYIRRASARNIDRIYSEYEAKRLEKANEFLTDLILSKFANLLGGLGALESSEALDEELQKGKLLKRARHRHCRGNYHAIHPVSRAA